MRCGGEYEGRHDAPLYILMQRQLQVPNGSFLFEFLRLVCVSQVCDRKFPVIQSRSY